MGSESELERTVGGDHGLDMELTEGQSELPKEKPLFGNTTRHRQVQRRRSTVHGIKRRTGRSKVDQSKGDLRDTDPREEKRRLPEGRPSNQMERRIWLEMVWGQMHGSGSEWLQLRIHLPTTMELPGSRLPDVPRGSEYGAAKVQRDQHHYRRRLQCLHWRHEWKRTK